MKIKSLILMTCLLVSLLAGTAIAQSPAQEQKFEAGAHFTALHLNEYDLTDNGAGVRLGYNLNAHIALEGELNFFPAARTQRTTASNLVIAQTRIQGFIGPKIGVRTKHYGVFVKARPGFLSSQITQNNLTGVGLYAGSDNNAGIALDVGGVVEYYPARRWILRVDAGDTIVRYQKQLRSFLRILEPPLQPTVNSTSHNFQFSAGVGWRF